MFLSLFSLSSHSLFIAHLRMKDAGDYTGAESDIDGKIKILDTDWFPNKNSWLMMSVANEEDQEEDMATVLAEVREEVGKVKSDMSLVKALVEHQFNANQT